MRRSLTSTTTRRSITKADAPHANDFESLVGEGAAHLARYQVPDVGQLLIVAEEDTQLLQSKEGEEHRPTEGTEGTGPILTEIP